ncbi:kinase-like domain-containing protein [Polychytrium aggregatum]|uniref:kinase-like domain-containing protein n=1 Tax=Polychytrium aggregatum TaxID=110093 RepID=UPI0022FE170D|nr:kinase-like domain-containing protein [Polychytrium aggregatum]KAI9204729.1 kinase-like domain-containing protein [Polychytrium aggregatum]
MVRCGARIPTTKRNLKDVTNQSGLPSKDDPASTSDPNLPYARHDYDLYDFKIKEQIGRGAFATVHLVKFAPRNLQDVSQPAVSEKSYAMKALRKKDIIATKQIKHVMNEKTILENVRFPFIVELLATFQDIKHLYLVMEYIPGGDMFTLLRKRRRFPESVARFYSSELVLALEYLHSKKIIYRDLKPENILIDVEGHIKIADFGFAKTVSETAQTFCGTPAYMAPEIILKTGYNKTVDWWSLGTLIYEMLAGYSPFIAATPLEIYENVLDGKISWSSQIGSTSKDLLKHLIEMIPRKRFGAGHWPNETKEIKGHPWFAGVNWRSIEDKKIAPPFTPKVTGTEDISNFDKYNEPSSVLEAAKGNVGKSEDGLYDEVFKDF